MTLWLVGAKGMLGRALAEQLTALGTELIQTDAETDISDRSAVLGLVRAERPTHIFNCAAYTRVDDAETHETDAERTNALGAENLALAASETRSCLVHFSTDYVFSGDASEPYLESAACAPGSAYGRTKLNGERRILAIEAERAPYIIRTSWLFGKHGANFVKTILQLLGTKQELRVVSDQVGRPTYARDLADAALRLTGFSPPSITPAPAGVYHFANRNATSWHGFACAIREGALARGLPVQTQRIVPVSTSEFPRPARRPAYSVLSTLRYESAVAVSPRPWREALEEYLDELVDLEA
jgi:dTDP-4-dehydrorhamnose reductase